MARSDRGTGTFVSAAAVCCAVMLSADPAVSGPPKPLCGNGVVEGYEECDNGTENSDTRPDACRTDCTLPSCGDGVVDSAEECDNGRGNSDLIPGACRTDCRGPYCGDGVVDLKLGEECEKGDPGCTECKRCVEPRDGMTITSDTTLCPGVFAIADMGTNGVITISGSGVVVDGGGAVIVRGSGMKTARGVRAPKGRPTGTAVVVTGTAVVVRDLTVTGYETGVEIRGFGAQLQRVTACANTVDIVRTGSGAFGFANACSEIRSWNDGGHSGCASGCEGAIPESLLGAGGAESSTDLQKAAARGALEAETETHDRAARAGKKHAVVAPTPTPKPTPRPRAVAGAKVSKKVIAGATMTQGQCTVRGTVRGRLQYVGAVAVYTADGRRAVARVKPARNGRYTISGLNPGTYLVRPLSGGKLSLESDPAQRTITCTAGGNLTVHFTIRGVGE